jgi:D-glycero-D-manno-heptose 1,7-bisphosphate phosphatase
MADLPRNKAVFLDRDGTINIEKNYLIDPLEFEFVPGVPHALKRLQDAGYLLVIVSNQAGVARGLFDLDDVDLLHRHMCRLLAHYGVRINSIKVCPHHPTAGQGEYLLDCNCRKGQPGMLLQAADELQIDLSRSFMVGDKLTDVEAGLAAGCTSFLVLTGYGKEQRRLLQNEEVCVLPDLPAVVNHMLHN